MLLWDNNILRRLDPGQASDWTLRAQLLGIGSGALSVLLAGYLLILVPLLEHLDIHQQQAIELKHTLHGKQLAVNALRQQQQQLAAMRSRTQITDPLTVTPFFTLLYQNAMAHHLRIEHLQSEAARHSPYRTAVRLTLSGTYHDLANFIKDLAALPSLASIGKFLLHHNKEGLLTLSVQIKAFDSPSSSDSRPISRLSAVTPNHIIQNTEAYQARIITHQASDPFDRQQRHSSALSDPMRADTHDPLESHELDQWQFVGIILYNNQTWGLIQAPDGEVHRIKPGSTIGPQHGKVTAISDRHITIETVISSNPPVQRIISLPLSTKESP